MILGNGCVESPLVCEQWRDSVAPSNLVAQATGGLHRMERDPHGRLYSVEGPTPSGRARIAAGVRTRRDILLRPVAIGCFGAYGVGFIERAVAPSNFWVQATGEWDLVEGPTLSGRARITAGVRTRRDILLRPVAIGCFGAYGVGFIERAVAPSNLVAQATRQIFPISFSMRFCRD